MTKLFVKPIEQKEPGSFKLRRAWRQMMIEVEKGRKSDDAALAMAAWEKAEEWIIGRLRTDDGTPVEEVLDTISADEFDALLKAVAPEAENVPPESASS